MTIMLDRNGLAPPVTAPPAFRRQRELTAKPAAPPAVPVPEPLSGDKILHQARSLLRHFAVWPSEDALTVATLWAAASHARDADGDPVWEYVPKLFFTADASGPTRGYGTGKSWFAKLTASLCPDPVILLEPTKPSLIDEIADRHTVVIKELDELLSTPGRNRGLVAVMNACYEPGSFHTRKRGGVVQRIHLFGPMILDGINTLLSATRPDVRALASRSIVVYVEMAPDGYRRPMWDKVAQDTAERGQRYLAAWMAAEVKLFGLGGAESLAAVPESLGNPRRCALYEPLFTVALRADQGDPGGYWSQEITRAALAIEASAGVPAAEDAKAIAVDAFMASIEE